MNKYIYIGVLLSVAVAVWGYGHHQYNNGYLKAESIYQAKQQKAQQQALIAEQKQRIELEKIREQYDADKQKQKLAMDSLHNDADRLRDTIARLRTRAPTCPTARTDETNQTYWLVLEQCVSRYEALAKDADELNSRLWIGQKWAEKVKWKLI